MSMGKGRFSELLLLVFACTLSQSVFAAGERMINAIMRSDFVFDRNISNVPFLPISWLSVSSQRNLESIPPCLPAGCEFDIQSVSQGFGLPAYISQKHMIILGQTLDADRFSFADKDYRLTTLGGLAAWVSQPSSKWQVGAGIYAYGGIDVPDGASKDIQSIMALAGRYRHRATFHSYYGLVRYQDFDSTRYYPYLGLDWYPNKHWSVAVLFPWPTLSYAPDTDSVYRIGALQSGTSFQLQVDGEAVSSQFNQWQLGLSAEYRVYNNLWGALTLGTSVMDGFYIDSGGEAELSFGLESAPFIRLSFNYRPE